MLDDIDYPRKVHFAVRAVVHVCAGRALNLQRKINSVNWEGAVRVVFFNFHPPSHTSPLSLSLFLPPSFPPFPPLYLPLSRSSSLEYTPGMQRIGRVTGLDMFIDILKRCSPVFGHPPSATPSYPLHLPPRYREYVYTATINYAVMPGAIISKIDKTADDLDRPW